jgi:sensor histidine kinase YesM
MELISVGVALGVPLMQWCFVEHMTLKYFLLQWLFSFVYANCVGVPLCVAMPRTWDQPKRGPATLRWLVRAATLVSGTAAGCLIAGLVLWSVFGKEYRYWPEFVWSFRLALILAAVISLFFAAYERMQGQLRMRELELRTKELERERALKLATESRLTSLESRIHPHFLFNTINSVSSLIHDDPDRAERLLTQMAGLLRFSLDSAQAGLVSLERELKIVRDYLEIEKARFAERLRYEISIPSDLMSAEVPPLSIQTLVENSIKYAVTSRRQGATVQVKAAAADGILTLEVADNGPGFADLQLPMGHGLSNLQERLTVLFGDDSKLDILSQLGATSVRVIVPCVANPKAAPGLARDVVAMRR